MAKSNVGDKFGRLTLIAQAEPNKYGQSRWFCKCECGNNKIVGQNDLRSGHTRSCGCLNIEMRNARHTTHGQRYSPEYNCWNHILDRCENKNSNGYKYYGARGIKVHGPWHKFENFFADKGKKPGPEYSLERIDNDGNYTPNNTRWATTKEQARNRRNTVKIDGQLLDDLAIIYGLKSSTIRARFKRGWSRSRLFVPKGTSYEFKNGG
jgi:hypothetical protein